MQTDILDFFFTPDGIGWLGPVALIILGFYMAKKSRGLGFVGAILEILFIANYLELIGAGEPAYWWHVALLILGGLPTCLLPTLLDR